VDVVVIVTRHEAVDYDLVAASPALVVDARNALSDRMAGQPNYFKA